MLYCTYPYCQRIKKPCGIINVLRISMAQEEVYGRSISACISHGQTERRKPGFRAGHRHAWCSAAACALLTEPLPQLWERELLSYSVYKVITYQCHLLFKNMAVSKKEKAIRDRNGEKSGFRAQGIPSFMYIKYLCQEKCHQPMLPWWIIALMFILRNIYSITINSPLSSGAEEAQTPNSWGDTADSETYRYCWGRGGQGWIRQDGDSLDGWTERLWWWSLGWGEISEWPVI